MAKKIKAAIKAKLIDLEAYVDDELPDYIMVMVANKKTPAQMSSDLALFLGDDAEKFATWLHRVIKKIEAISADKQKNNNNPEPSSKAPSETRESTPPAQKKIAMSFKKKIDLKSKIGGGNTPLETSPAASPRPHDIGVSSGINVSSAASLVSSASLHSPAPHRSPSPADKQDLSAKKRKSEVDKDVARTSDKDEKTKRRKGVEDKKEEKKRKKGEGSEEKNTEKSKREQRKTDVEDKETQIVVIMKQIQRLKQQLQEEEASGSEEEEEDQQQLGDRLRAKISTLRERLESIQEELNGDEEEGENESSKEEEPNAEEERKEAEDVDEGSKIVGDCADEESGARNHENDVSEKGKEILDNGDVRSRVENDDDEPYVKSNSDVESNESLGDVVTNANIKIPATNNSDIDSRCTTPLMDELPSPGDGRNSNDGSPEDDQEEETRAEKPEENREISAMIKSDESSENSVVAPVPDMYRHLPAFLPDSSEWRRCAHCGTEEKDGLVCLECEAALHCQNSSNCFRAWHLNGNTRADVPDEPGFKLYNTIVQSTLVISSVGHPR